jgi:hypothetical protein
MVHYAYTILHSWSEHVNGENGAHDLGGVVLTPSADPVLTCAKLPTSGLTGRKIPPPDADDGVLVAENATKIRSGINISVGRGGGLYETGRQKKMRRMHQRERRRE